MTTVEEPTLQMDMALMKRAAAKRYVRERHLLRNLVRYGLVTPEQARTASFKLRQVRLNWIAARTFLREIRNNAPQA